MKGFNNSVVVPVIKEQLVAKTKILLFEYLFSLLLCYSTDVDSSYRLFFIQIVITMRPLEL